LEAVYLDRNGTARELRAISAVIIKRFIYLYLDLVEAAGIVPR